MTSRTILLLVALFVAFYTNAQIKEQRTSIFSTNIPYHAEVVFLGNSITNFAEWPEFFPDVQVINRGINGNNTDDVLARLSDVIAIHPKKLFLTLGINDIFNGWPQSKTVGNMTTIIDRILTEAPTTKLYVHSVLPLDGVKAQSNADKVQKVVDLNNEIKAICVKKGVTYIDLFPVLAVSKTNNNMKPEYNNDGVHLLPAGYKAWAGLIKDYVGSRVAFKPSFTYNKAPGKSNFFEQRLALNCALEDSDEDILMIGDYAVLTGEWSEYLNNKHVKRRGFGDGPGSSVPTVKEMENIIKDIVTGTPGKIFLYLSYDAYVSTPTADIAASFTTIVNNIKQKTPGTEIYLQSVLPTGNAANNVRVKEVNSKLRSVCSETGATYVDLYTKFVTSSDVINGSYSQSSQWLNGNGYRYWANVIAPLIGDDFSAVPVTGEVDIYSAAMNKSFKANVYVPVSYKDSPAKRYPVVYLLHGYGENYQSFNTYGGSLKDMADRYDFIIVTPTGERSWYWDTNATNKFLTYIGTEIVDFIDSNYRTIASREGRAISGVSMGGQGAFYIAYSNKDKFGAIGAISGGVNMREYYGIFGVTDLLGSYASNSAVWLNRSIVNMTDQINPGDFAINFDCGLQEEYFLADNDLLSSKMKERGISHTYRKCTGGHYAEFAGYALETNLKFFSGFFGLSPLKYEKYYAPQGTLRRGGGAFCNAIKTEGAVSDIDYSTSVRPNTVYNLLKETFYFNTGEEVKINFSGDASLKNHHKYLYVDLNGDGDFDDDNETVKSVAANPTGGVSDQNLSAAFIIPAASKGVKGRIRARFTDGANQTLAQLNLPDFAVNQGMIYDMDFVVMDDKPVSEVVNIRSAAMSKNINATIILPNAYNKNPDKNFPVFYLLHGHSDTYRSWITSTDIVNQANKYNMIVVCPDGATSWYMNSPQAGVNLKYETYISKEVVGFVDANYRTIASREGRAISGNSMGGHGAWYNALKNKEVFGAVGSTAGGVNIDSPNFANNWNIKDNLGVRNSATPSNWYPYAVTTLAKNINDNDYFIYFDCGLNEELFQAANRELRDLLTSRGVSFTYNESPGGHNWNYWKGAIVNQFIAFNSYFGSGISDDPESSDSQPKMSDSTESHWYYIQATRGESMPCYMTNAGGGVIKQAAVANNAAQQWRLFKSGDGFVLQSRSDNRYLNSDQASMSIIPAVANVPSKKLQLRKSVSTEPQVTAEPDKYFYIENVGANNASFTFRAHQGGSNNYYQTYNYTYPESYNDNSSWKFILAQSEYVYEPPLISDGNKSFWYKIQSTERGEGVGVPNYITYKNNKVYQSPGDDSYEQQWRLVRSTDGFYLQNRESQEYLNSGLTGDVEMGMTVSLPAKSLQVRKSLSTEAKVQASPKDWSYIENVGATDVSATLRLHATNDIYSYALRSWTQNSLNDNSSWKIEFVEEESLSVSCVEMPDAIKVYKEGEYFVVKSEQQSLVNVSLFDCKGRMVLSLGAEGSEIKLPASNLPNGLYVIMVQTSYEAVACRVLVQ